MTTMGVRALLLRVERLDRRWQITVRDESDRIMSFYVPDAPAAIRAAVGEWTDLI
jgi:hypothetical protein